MYMGSLIEYPFVTLTIRSSCFLFVRHNLHMMFRDVHNPAIRSFEDVCLHSPCCCVEVDYQA